MVITSRSHPIVPRETQAASINWRESAYAASIATKSETRGAMRGSTNASPKMHVNLETNCDTSADQID